MSIDFLIGINKFSGYFNRYVTKAYLRQRLHTHDHLGQLKFSDKQVRNIYQASGGLPGRINHEMNKMLDDSQGNGKRSKKIDQKSKPNHLRT
jgi:hypothetical protein